jgi:hypothetical protein
MRFQKANSYQFINQYFSKKEEESFKDNAEEGKKCDLLIDIKEFLCVLCGKTVVIQI